MAFTEKQKRERKRAADRAYYQRNKEKRRIRSRVYYDKNKKKICLNRKIYYLEHQDNLNAKSRKYYRENKDNILLKAIKYYCSHLKERRKYARDYANKHRKTFRYKEKQYKYHRKFRKLNPIQIKSGAIYRYAIKKGKIIRQSCKICGTTKNVQGHHDDYTKPLDVRWLCITCHGIESRKYK